LQVNNRQIIHSKMKEHFARLRDGLDRYEEKCEQTLSTLLKKQEAKVTKIQD